MEKVAYQKSRDKHVLPPVNPLNELQLATYIKPQGAYLYDDKNVPQCNCDENDNLSIKFKELNGTEFKPIGCKYSQQRVCAFKEAFETPGEWTKYLADMPHVTETIGIQNQAISAYTNLLTQVYGDRVCVPPVEIVVTIPSDDTEETTVHARFHNTGVMVQNTLTEPNHLQSIINTFCPQQTERIFFHVGVSYMGEMHANFLGLDSKNFFVFEPHGTCAVWYPAVVTALGKLLPQTVVNIHCVWKYGPQLYDDIQEFSWLSCRVKPKHGYGEDGDGGFCVSWSLLFLTVQIARANVFTIKQISGQLRQIFRSGGKNARANLIRQFTYMTGQMIPNSLNKWNRSNMDFIRMVNNTTQCMRLLEHCPETSTCNTM